MASLFISYSRKDIDLARKLTETLNAQGLDTWIDWEGIPPTRDWWQEIEKGIEEADVFLFLLSPDSIKSEVCNREIEHAAKNGKRLIPIVVRDIKADDSPAKLSILNWIFLRESDDFDTGFNKLITAIKTDYEWVQIHRQLQVKALEWERNNHENSFLLRGKELKDAELQLVANSSKEPQPTDLHRDYVLKSRQATDKIRRRVIIGLVSFSTVVLGLLIFSLIQLNISRAQQLGFQAEVAYAELNHNKAALYAYQSNQIHKNDAADQVISKLYYENFALAKSLIGHSNGVNSVSWSVDGRLASASIDQTVIIWNLASGQPAQTLKGHTDSIDSVAWSPDGRLASASWDEIVILWDLDNGQPAQTLKGHRVAWSADGQLASADKEGTVIIWNLANGQPAKTLNGHTDSVESVAWSVDGRFASGSRDGTVIIWDLASGQPAQILMGYGVAWSADGRLATVNGDTIIIWNLSTGQPAQTLKGSKGSANVSDVAWSPDGRLASAYIDGTIIIWDLVTAKLAQIVAHTNSATSVAWSPDGRLASGSWDKTVKIPRKDLLEIKPCDWIYRNLTMYEWDNIQGYLYTYKPACPNLPYPTFSDPMISDPTFVMTARSFTWQGRVIFFGILLVLLLVLFVILRAMYKLVWLVWQIRINRNLKKSNLV